MGIVVFDLEGVLVDNRDRYKEALRSIDDNARSYHELRGYRRSLFWRRFMDPNLAAKVDRVNLKALELWVKRRREGHKMVILSGTRREVVNVLLRKIEEEARNLGMEFKPDFVVWRPSGDRRKSHVFKREKLREIEALIGDEVIEVHEDDPETVEELRKLGYNVVRWVDLEPDSPVG